MQKIFEVTDRYKGRDVTATILVDTLIDDHDMLRVTAATDEHGHRVPLSAALVEQFTAAFINEYEEDYNEILLTAAALGESMEQHDD